MTITRIFRVQIQAGLRREFEEASADISVRAVEEAAGLVSVFILRPTKWSPEEYAMITHWRDEASLEAFAGRPWNRAVIPRGMERFVEECHVLHYESWDRT